jgi:protoporphyrinogen oxidase
LRANSDATLEQTSGPAQRIGTAIVGAGPSGLSAGWRLERLGEKDFRVFELEAQAGGTSSYGTDGAVPYPWGAHYVPVPSARNQALIALLDELGVIERDQHGEIIGKEPFVVREPEERLFFDGVWHPGLFPTELARAFDLAELARFNREVARWVRFRDARGRRAFTLPMRHCSDAAEVTELDKISAERWLRSHGFSSKLLFWHVEYACRDDYGLTLETTSAWAMLFYFASRVPAPGRETADFLAWPEGNGRLVRHLAHVVGARLQTEQLVTDIVPSEDSVDLCVLDARTGRLTRYQADAVILAVPKFVVPRLLRPWRRAPPDHLAAFSYGAWLVANLHLSERPRSVGSELAWDNVIFESRALGYVVATHQRLLDLGPTIFTYYQPLLDSDPDAARKRLASLEHAEFVDSIMSDLEPAHSDLEHCVERIDVWRWGHAMIRPVPGFIWGSARRKASEPRGRIHFAHSDLSGLALFEEAQDRGVLAAEAVLRSRGHEFEPLSG